MNREIKDTLVVRRSEERGYFDHGWLKTFHTFSFAGYLDPAHMGFRALRVINEDWVAPKGGFGTHPHSEMEILTYVVQGELTHEDSMGNRSSIRPGEIQCMSAGTGITHSERNLSPSEPVHLLQIWVRPGTRGRKPGYEQKQFSSEEKRNRLRLIVSMDGEDGSLVMHQDVRIYASLLDEGRSVLFSPGEGRHTWIQVIRGQVETAGVRLRAGDGACTGDASKLEILGREDCEWLLFDLA